MVANSDASSLFVLLKFNNLMQASQLNILYFIQLKKGSGVMNKSIILSQQQKKRAGAIGG
jgi:hypothetical protein